MIVLDITIVLVIGFDLFVLLNGISTFLNIYRQLKLKQVDQILNGKSIVGTINKTIPDQITVFSITTVIVLVLLVIRYYIQG